MSNARAPEMTGMYSLPPGDHSLAGEKDSWIYIVISAKREVSLGTGRTQGRGYLTILERLPGGGENV